MRHPAKLSNILDGTIHNFEKKLGKLSYSNDYLKKGKLLQLSFHTHLLMRNSGSYFQRKLKILMKVEKKFMI